MTAKGRGVKPLSAKKMKVFLGKQFEMHGMFWNARI